MSRVFSTLKSIDFIKERKEDMKKLIKTLLVILFIQLFICSCDRTLIEENEKRKARERYENKPDTLTILLDNMDLSMRSFELAVFAKHPNYKIHSKKVVGESKYRIFYEVVIVKSKQY